jgi:hypothetical protein
VEPARVFDRPDDVEVVVVDQRMFLVGQHLGERDRGRDGEELGAEPQELVAAARYPEDPGTFASSRIPAPAKRPAARTSAGCSSQTFAMNRLRCGSDRTPLKMSCTLVGVGTRGQLITGDPVRVYVEPITLTFRPPMSSNEIVARIASKLF